MNSSDYKKLFEQSSFSEVVIDTDFTIVAAYDVFLKSTNTVLKNIISKNLFEVFPENPHESIIRTSFDRVLITKAPDTLSVVRYDIPNPDGVGFIQKYWRPTHSPVLDALGNVKYIIQRVEDATENKILIEQHEKIGRASCRERVCSTV